MQQAPHKLEVSSQKEFLSGAQSVSEIEKGMEDIKAGRVYSADEVEAEMKREFGI